jgi:hypothetical protein
MSAWSCTTSKKTTLALKVADSLFLSPQIKQLGEIKRFHSLERSLYAKGQFQEFATVVNEYFDLEHAESVPPNDL